MNKLNAVRLIASAALATTIALPALAQTSVKQAWVRGTVAEQKATGAFMQLTSTQGGKLLSVSSPAAGVVEIHQMKMEGSTMKMAQGRRLRGVDLGDRRQGRQEGDRCR